VSRLTPLQSSLQGCEDRRLLLDFSGGVREGDFDLKKNRRDGALKYVKAMRGLTFER
jgi:hypothetical protein